MTGFYRKFIKHYATVATPLTNLLRKDQFIWTPTATQAFDDLKTLMTKALILATSDFSLPFALETDAFSSAIGAVLIQNGHPIAYYSKVLCPCLQ